MEYTQADMDTFRMGVRAYWREREQGRAVGMTVQEAAKRGREAQVMHVDPLEARLSPAAFEALREDYDAGVYHACEARELAARSGPYGWRGNEDL